MKLQNNKRPYWLEVVASNVYGTYDYAYALAHRFRHGKIPDDVKENVALKALENAIMTFEPARKLSLTTHIYVCVINALKNESKRLNTTQKKLKRVQKKRDISYTLFKTDTDDNFLDIFECKESLKNVTAVSTLDNLAYVELKKCVDSKLTGRQRTILHMLLHPNTYIDKYKNTYRGKDKLKFIPSSLSNRTIGKLLDVTPFDVMKDMKDIQKKTNKILSEINLEATGVRRKT